MTRFYHKSTHIGHLITGFRKIAIITSFLLGFIVASCEKEPTTIGTDLLPQSDFVSIGGTDTITPISFSMYDQRVRTDNSAITYLGEIHDPYFGTTTASFVTQLRLRSDWDYDSFILDSVRLFLRFNNVIGGTTGTNTISFYEIQDQLYKDTIYYSNQQVTLGGFKIENLPLPTLTPDSVNVVSIKLPNAMFGSYLLRDTSKLFHSNTVPDFRTFFKGLQFKINSTGDPLLVTLDMAYTGEGITIMGRPYNNFFLVFGHKADGTLEEYYFIIDALNPNVSFSLYEHNFTSADPDKVITHYNNPSYRDTLTYLQSINGLYTRIVLPGLKVLKDSAGFKNNMAINKARLTIPYFYDNINYTNAKAPEQIFLRYRTTSGAKPFVQDILVDDNQEFFGGSIDTINHVYNFNIPTFVQAYLEDTSGEILPELELMQGTGISNLILKANASRTPLRFELTYTRF
jgi:hypothetical protein